MTREEVVRAAVEYFQFRIKDVEKKVEAIRNKASQSPGAMESWSDKSKDEFTQLADGLARELDPLKASAKLLAASKFQKVVGVGSILALDEDYYLIVPYAGGDLIRAGETELFLLSAGSELGKLLLGKKVNDAIEWRGKWLGVKKVL